MLSRFDDSNVPAARPNHLDASLNRWEQEQLFEEDLRAVLGMLRPNRQERLLGWSEYRTGGAGFRATISWDPEVEHAGAAGNARQRPGHNPADEHFVVPQMTDVLEAILVGSVKGADDMAAEQEFEFYREVIRELHRRLDEMQRCYE
jgi:zona occludens toxin (predicted ATPase)